MVGIVEDLPHVTTQWFKSAGHTIILLGATKDDLGASEYSLATLGNADGSPPHLDLETECRVQEACLAIIQAGLVESAHDCSDGGLAIALAECTFSSYRRDAVGCEVNLEGSLTPASLLFSESPSRMVVSALEENVEQILNIAREIGIQASVLGKTGGDRLVIGVNGQPIIDRSIAEIEEAWRGTLPANLEIPSLLAAEEALTS
jgi:phosphoribosylformylglycinamidine synthase